MPKYTFTHRHHEIAVEGIGYGHFSTAIMGLFTIIVEITPSSSGAPGIPWKVRSGGYKVTFYVTYKGQSWVRQFMFTRWLPVKIIGTLMAKYKKPIAVKGVRII